MPIITSIYRISSFWMLILSMGWYSIISTFCAGQVLMLFQSQVPSRNWMKIPRMNDPMISRRDVTRHDFPIREVLENWPSVKRYHENYSSISMLHHESWLKLTNYWYHFDSPVLITTISPLMWIIIWYILVNDHHNSWITYQQNQSLSYCDSSVILTVN
jgi:hypothetical protein